MHGLNCTDKEQSELAKSRCQIKIILTTSTDVFPTSKTLPSLANVRGRLRETSLQTKADIPTPFYNASLRACCSSLPFLEMLHRASTTSDGFSDACILGSIWLRQRGIGSSINTGGFGQFEWAYILATLLHGAGPKGIPRIPTSSTSARLFKTMISFLANRNLAVEYWDTGFAMKDFNSKGVPIFMDADCGMNILFKTRSWWYTMIRYEAKQSLSALDEASPESFEQLFIIKVKEPIYRFDSMFDIPLPNSSKSTPKFPSGESAGLNHVQEYCTLVHAVMSTALTDRVNLVCIEAPRSLPWPVVSRKAQVPVQKLVTLGLEQNPGQCFRSVDYGPSADEKELAASFRRFWGEKAELRRFNDGRILECLTWTSAEGISILDQIVNFAANHHFSVNTVVRASSGARQLPKLLGSNNMESVVSLTPYQPILNAFEELETIIRSLEGLPLQVRQISGHSSFLRYAAVSMRKQPILASPIDICIQFEGSARWPNDFAAIQRTKIAFLLKLGELLEDAVSQSECRVGLENEGSRTLNLSFLDIRLHAGFLFRLRIYHEREMSILQNSLKEKSFELGGREVLASSISYYKRLFVQGPLHTQALRTLCTRFPLISPCMRLLKIWRDSHLLSCHISDELLELLVIQVFVRPYPWSTPGSIISGFFRTLYLVSKWDWRSTPLIVDCSGNMMKDDYQDIRTRFDAWKEIDPGMNRMVMFAASNTAPDGFTWTETGPSLVSAARFTELAKAACSLVKMEGLDVDVAPLFMSPTGAFDFLLHIKAEFFGVKKTGKKSAFKNMILEDDQSTRMSLVQAFVEELRSLYGQDVMFFCNGQKMDVIAGLWNPHTTSRPWKVNLGYSSIPSSSIDEGSDVGINRPATLNDMARLGGDIIGSTEINLMDSNL